jgi:hypothetical protein
MRSMRNREAPEHSPNALSPSSGVQRKLSAI